MSLQLDLSLHILKFSCLEPAVISVRNDHELMDNLNPVLAQELYALQHLAFDLKLLQESVSIVTSSVGSINFGIVPRIDNHVA